MSKKIEKHLKYLEENEEKILQELEEEFSTPEKVDAYLISQGFSLEELQNRFQNLMNDTDEKEGEEDSF